MSLSPAPRPDDTTTDSQVPTLDEVLDAAEELWPRSLAESWDAVGLVTGRRDALVRRINFAVDPVRAVIEEASNSGTDLLITHHPLLLKGVTSVAEASDGTPAE